MTLKKNYGPLAKGMVAFSSLIPIEFFLATVRFFLFRLGAFARTKNGRILSKNMREVLGYNPGSQGGKHFARQVVDHQLRVFFETCRVVRGACPKVEGLEEFRENMRSVEDHNLGKILITAHLGNWEILGKYCAQVTLRNFYALAKPSPFSLMNQILDYIRQSLGVLVLWTGKNNFQRQIIQVLKKQDWVAFVMDQKPRGRQGPLVRFFDKHTEFFSGFGVWGRRGSRF